MVTKETKRQMSERDTHKFNQLLLDHIQRGKKAIEDEKELTKAAHIEWEKLSATTKIYCQKYADLIAENKKLKNDSKQNNMQGTGYNQQTISLQIENTDLKDAKRRMEAAVAKLQRDQLSAEDTINKLNLEILSIQEEKKGLETKLDKLQHDNDNYESQLNTLQVELSGNYNVVRIGEQETVNIDFVVKKFQSVRDNTISNLTDTILDIIGHCDDDKADKVLKQVKYWTYDLCKKYASNLSIEEIRSATKQLTEKLSKSIAEEMCKSTYFSQAPTLEVSKTLKKAADDIVDLNICMLQLTPIAQFFFPEVGQALVNEEHKVVSRANKNPTKIKEVLHPGLKLAKVGRVIEQAEVCAE
jgi:hypothetical protein